MPSRRKKRARRSSARLAGPAAQSAQGAQGSAASSRKAGARAKNARAKSGKAKNGPRPHARGPLSVQERYAPGNRCFGCGQKNPKGLRLKSFEGEDGGLVARFRPAPHHLAFEGIVNGGIVGALLDCHANWAAAMALMKAQGLAAAPCTVTAEFHVKLRRPTPLDAELALHARAVEIAADRAVVEATLSARGEVTATCRGVFVAVRPDHPAYHRW